jgi:hypothetical protein
MDWECWIPVFDHPGMDRQRQLVMLQQPGWNIVKWYHWLTDHGFVIGQDYRWNWANNEYAVQFFDPHMELLARLKLKETE